MANSGKRGSVKQAANGTWEFVVDRGVDADGKRRQTRRRGFRTKREATEALDKVLSELVTGTYVPPSRQTLSEYLEDEWLPSIKGTIRPSTWGSYRHNLVTHVCARPIGRMRLQDIDGPALNKLYAQMGEPTASRRGTPLSPRTINYTATILHRALKDAVRWQRIPRNPHEQSDPPSGKHRRPKHIWTAEQLSAFFEYIKDDPLYALWVLIGTTGMRRGEALGLAWGHIGLDDASARISLQRQLVPDWESRSSRGWQFAEPKTKAGYRNIALDAGLTVPALRGHRTRQAELRLLVGQGWQLGATEEVLEAGGMVFCRPDGLPIEPAWATEEFSRLVRNSKLPRVTLHGLRHTWATLALKAGVHPKVVQERLGHSSVMVTLDMYSQVSGGMDEEAADAVAALLDKPIPDGTPKLQTRKAAGGTVSPLHGRRPRKHS